MIKNLQTILRVLPREIANNLDADNIEEIRIRANRNIILKYTNKEEIKEYIPSQRAANLSKEFDNSGLDSALARADKAEENALKILSGNFEGMQ